MKTVKLILVLFLVSMVQLSQAVVELPAIVSSNMVLQRNTTVVLWGWAETNEKVSIKASWLKGVKHIEADNEGRWSIEVKTTSSKIPQTIRIKSKKSDILLDNILFGEVWLCSGQSNMEDPVKGYNGQPVFGSAMAIAKSNNPNLRLFSLDRVGSKVPLKNIEKYSAWQQASPNSVINFSAVAYFFGQQLQEILDVPVGIILSSWGGSRVEAWMSPEVLSNYQEIDIEEADLKKSNNVPTALFNAMINPLTKYKIKGAIWYQGESNRRAPQKYKELFPAMVKDWRLRWGIGDFPFYYVQIAPYNGYERCNTAFLREAQLKCLDLIPNSGMAITMDLGDDDCPHPPRKKEVANRLVFNALSQTYGYTALDCASPMYDAQEKIEDGILLKFKYAETGLYASDELQGFEMAGEDKVFYPAKAKIVNRMNVLVKSDKVPNPVAVRYAWQNWIVGTLFDSNLLPASSFRTDDWDDAIQFEK